MINFYGKVLPLFRKCMRISTIIVGIQISCSTILMATGTRAQEMTLNVTKANVKQVFKQIERQANVTFVYDEQVINSLPAITLHVRNEQLSDVINELKDQTKLEYKVVGNYIGVASNLEDIPRLTPLQSDNSVPIKITGLVRDATGQPIIGANVMVKGTTRGTQTSVSGQFSIDANVGDVLVFTYLGYVKKEVTIGTSINITVELTEDSKQIGEVVVTALGIKKERKALGYSVTEVKGDELTQAREANVMNDIEGKVAGVNISPTAGGAGASTSVIIRGVSSLTQTTQPLYVINGIPMENTPNSNNGGQYANQSDLGDAIGNINPDDIESISVLKGAAASALYGSRGKAGVILITTKSGNSNSIEFNSNYVAEQVINPTHFQYVYGQGANGLKPTSAADAFQNGQASWGGKLDGSSVIQFDGVSRPYVAQRNNFDEFYRTGGTATNTVALNRSFEGGSVRFSASDLDNTAITPNSGLQRQTFNLSANYNVTKRLTADIRANYILEQAKNRPVLADQPGNANTNVAFLPTSVDVNTLKKATNADGSEYAYSSDVNATNPWFAANDLVNNTNRQRLIASATLRYNFDDGYFIQGRAARDSYNDRYTSIVPTGTAYLQQGSMTENTTNFSDLNADVLMGKVYKVHNLTITPNIGASYRREKSEEFSLYGTQFIVPGDYVFNNIQFPNTVGYYPSDELTESVYGTLELDYKSYLYLNGSIRNDWYSTLASTAVNNTLNKAYPSVNGSFVFSEFLHADWLSFGKLRAGFAQVGQATTPYQTTQAYTFAGSPINGYPLGLISNPNVPNTSLVASLATELEIGTEMRFLKNRLSLDFTWYDKNSKDEILDAPASITSGYDGAVLNIGKLQNKGIEVLISGTPFQTKDFHWTTTLNASMNNNKVIALADGQPSLLVATSRSGNGFTQDIVGLPVDQVMAFDYQRDASGKIVTDASGVPVQGALKAYGSAIGKWSGGLTNEFAYKRFNLSFLIDTKLGGKIFSGTDYYAYQLGLDKATLVNRDALGQNAASYYSNLSNNVSSMFVLNDSFIKFRQITFGYSFPANLFNGSVKSLNVSFVGRNLFYIMKKTDNIDPESDYSQNATGIELGGVPPTRTYGLNLNVKF
jgi:TonB-linked SusC/RagA family outer membrane protein